MVDATDELKDNNNNVVTEEDHIHKSSSKMEDETFDDNHSMTDEEEKVEIGSANGENEIENDHGEKEEEQQQPAADQPVENETKKEEEVVQETTKPKKLEQKVSIISVSDLAAELSTYQVVDARPRAKFIEGHIVGSYHMEWEDWTYRCPKRLWNKFGLGRPTLLSRVVDDKHTRGHNRLTLLKLNSRKPIVVVGEPFEWGADGRIAWNLLFWGCTDVSLLDGGFPKWEKEQRDHIESGLSLAQTLLHSSSSSRRSVDDDDSSDDDKLKFDVCYQEDRRATTIDVHMLMARDESKQTPWYPLLIDTRSEEEYEGSIKMPNQRRYGRIAKSVSIPANKLYHKEDGTFIQRDELHDLLLEAGNKDGTISEDENAIAYCTAGVRSGLLSVLAEALLGLHIKNYDTSLWEWASNRNNLMEVGSNGGSSEGAATTNGDNGGEEKKDDSDVDDIIGDLKSKESTESNGIN